MKSVTLLSVLLAAGLISAAAYASVNASVDSDQVAAGDTVELTLSHDGQTGAQPDLAALRQDFDVLSTSRSSNVRIVNGSLSSETQLRLTLSPKRSGQLTIPSLRLGQRTDLAHPDHGRRRRARKPEPRRRNPPTCSSRRPWTIRGRICRVP